MSVTYSVHRWLHDPQGDGFTSQPRSREELPEAPLDHPLPRIGETMSWDGGGKDGQVVDVHHDLDTGHIDIYVR